MSNKKTVKTTCGVCGSCCPIIAHVNDGVLESVEGRTPAVKMCAKGMAAKQFLYHEDRVLYPMKRVGKKGEGKFVRISWKEAMDLITEKLLKNRDEYGARSTLFYAGYPKWFRPALLRLSNAYGTPNFCTESSTCFQAAQLAWGLVYGNRICGPDLKNTKTLLVWSSNLYHSNKNMIGGYKALKERGGKIIVVDPRHTVTAHDADIHLQLEAGTDGALALALANVILEENLHDSEFIDRYVYGFEDYRDYVKAFTPEYAEKITKVPAGKIRQAARMFAENKPSAIQFSASAIVHHINGVQNYRAVFALSALTGNYDVEGGNCPKSMPVSPCNEFGKVRRLNGIEAIGEKDFPVWYDLPCQEAQCARLADYILEENPYPLKTLFAMGLNHRMWPQPEHLQRALEKLDFYVNVELFLSESSNAADLVLPACTSYERDQLMTGGGFSFSHKAVTPAGEARNDIEIILDLAKRLGVEDEVLKLNYEEYRQYILEPSGLTLDEVRESESPLTGKNVIQPSYRNYEREAFNTPSGKIELKSLVLENRVGEYGYDTLPVYHDFRKEAEVNREEYPLILSTGCRKPQYFHSRIHRLSWLSGLEETPLVELHPDDGKKYGINDGDPVQVNSPAGELRGIAGLNVGGNRGAVYIYHGNAKGDANELIAKDYLDPISGFPGFRSYFCKIKRLEVE